MKVYHFQLQLVKGQRALCVFTIIGLILPKMNVIK